MVCVRIVWWIFWRGIVFGALLGALFGTFIAPLIGMAFGGFYGAIIGVIMGAVDAFALGATAHFFMDMDQPERIVPVLRLIGITLNLIGVGLYMVILFGSELMFSQPLFMIIPPVLAAGVVTYLCPRFVTYAVRVQLVMPHQTITAMPQTQTKSV